MFMIASHYFSLHAVVGVTVASLIAVACCRLLLIVPFRSLLLLVLLLLSRLAVSHLSLLCPWGDPS